MAKSSSTTSMRGERGEGEGEEQGKILIGREDGTTREGVGSKRRPMLRTQKEELSWMMVRTTAKERMKGVKK